MSLCSKNVDHLTRMNKNIFKTENGINLIQLGRTKSTGIVKNSMGPHFKSELIKDIGNSPYSLLIDESTDISVTKKLGVAIIYYSEKSKSVVSTFLALHSLEKGDAASIVKAVKEVVQDFNLDLLKMQGIGTDNASVMTGVNTGVYKRLKAEIPHLILIRCVCHSIELAVSEAVTHSLPKHLEFLINDTYLWFSRSADRQGDFQNLYNAMNDGNDPLKIKLLKPVGFLFFKLLIAF